MLWHRAGVLNGHFPAGEVNDTPAGRKVSLEERRSLEHCSFGHLENVTFDVYAIEINGSKENRQATTQIFSESSFVRERPVGQFR